jgi:hypothetical protein
MGYYEKYLKYKKKYLELQNLQNIQYGGDKPIIRNVNRINLFKNPIMKEYLNPIYGLILCNIGLIPNLYFLDKSGFINTELSKIIDKVCKEIPGSIQPTNKIMELKPIDFGRYIGLKFINIDNPNTITLATSGKINFNFKNKENPRNKLSYDDDTNITNYIGKLRNYIPFDKNDDITIFHLILFCLWWTANNDAGIEEYYIGINEVFGIINKYLPEDKRYLLINIDKKKSSNSDTNSFEQIVYEITYESFKIYNQEWAKNFCSSGKNTYPDCGEVTARNLINLLCWDEKKFDIKLIEKFNPVAELEEYYRVFDNFDKQSAKFKKEDLPEIYNYKLDARDAWSKLIIDKAQNNVNFIQTCNSNGTRYELNAGLSLNKKTSNFFQLIKNLLPGINNWEDIKNEDIIEIKDNTSNGIGDIIIKHKKYNELIIHCQSGHYYMELKKVDKDIKYDNLNEKQVNTIEILLKKTITLDNYFYINFNSELLEAMINDEGINKELKIKLFELSLTDKYDGDLRRRIKLDVDSDYFNSIVKKLNENTERNKDKKVNEYTYYCNDFIFVEKILNLVNLNSKIKNINIESIDLSPLSQVQSIGNSFLYGCSKLTSIDLSPLSKIELLENGFLFGCNNLTSIDLSPLKQIKSINDYFMCNCSNLKSINLSHLLNLESIGNAFMSYCEKLIDIDLSNLSKIKSIGHNFMFSCALKSIDLFSFKQIKLIGNDFLVYCSNLKSIDLYPLSQIESIGNNFMESCDGITSIDLSPLTQIKSIGNNFMRYCKSLTSINFSTLKIDLRLIKNCGDLTSKDFYTLINLKSIGNNFLEGCKSLTHIDLSYLSNLESVGNNFMSGSNPNLTITCTEKQREILVKSGFDLSKIKLLVKNNGIISFDFKSLDDPEFKQKFLDFKSRYDSSKDDLCIYNGVSTQDITQYIILDDTWLRLNNDKYIKYLFIGDKILAYAVYMIEDGNILNLLLLCSNNKFGKGSGKILLDNIYEEFVNTKDFIMKLQPATYESLLQYYLNWKKPTFGDKTNYGGRQEEETYGYFESYGYLFYIKTGDISRVPRKSFNTFGSIKLFLNFFKIDEKVIEGMQLDRLKDFFTEQLKKNPNIDKSYIEQITNRIEHLNIPFLKFYLKSDTYISE